MALRKLREDFGYFLPPPQATPLYYVTNLDALFLIAKTNSDLRLAGP